jgi:hypothetical protein
MQEQEIIHFLSMVGDELQDVGLTQPVHILLIGGAYMLTQIRNRATTQDVDVIILAPATSSHEYTIFKQIVRFVVQDQGINPSWLSDNIAEFLQPTGNIPTGKLWFRRGNLEVYIPMQTTSLPPSCLPTEQKIRLIFWRCSNYSQFTTANKHKHCSENI